MAGCLKPLSKFATADSPAAKKVEEALGHEFADRSLLDRALTHASFTGGRNDGNDLERLEFLGDRVLGLLAAEELWRRFPNYEEGDLAPRFNALVRKETCAEAARLWQVGPALCLSTGEDRAGGRKKEAILGDACEALLGALYMDGGFEAARKAFNSYWGERFHTLVRQHQDPKTALQEWAQDQKLGTPRYVDVQRLGPDHAPEFTVAVHVDTLPPSEGVGPSKRDAQMRAARQLLEREKVWTEND